MNTENYMGSRRRCCQNDGCNQDPLPAIVRNHTENGLRCPSCIAAFSETCTSTLKAVCVGEETHCVAVSGLAQPGIRFAARGCGTEAACHSKPGTLVPSGSRLLTIKKTSCRPGPQASGKAESRRTPHPSGQLSPSTTTTESRLQKPLLCSQQSPCDEKPSHRNQSKHRSLTLENANVQE
ncbi:phospholipase A2 inhibitor and Ly6/PLAUR domain-containing protein-like [Cervus elaphus]|uniref:phospholipase A2 inhibitor and Ly6/PLAUR domain-containing protein-like n=1 Tax=Cervus elaphus TaxID=9860 RepID=UPI001CC2E553|nr:phospholipase A2 inhibitor and Ly6/PLAUR domain-containing protein-like [Cervus elaphus]